jgi:hypothetical protein
MSKMTEHSEKAKRLIDRLSENELQQIRKDNPFRIERNEKIHGLCVRGVAHVTLAEVCGLSGAAIGKICADMDHDKGSEGIERG